MNKNLLLILIIILATILRFFNLNRYPPSLYWDEAAIGYNAYSILTTGKDEYGKQLPVTFESFQDSKLPGYIYLTSISEKIFGLNEFAVRFPSALLGTISVYLVFIIAKILFGKKSTYIPFISSFLMAISPWALQFSRVGFEANAALTFSLLGIYFYLTYITRQRYYYLALAAIVLSFYFYYQQWIFFPLLIVVSAFFMRNRISFDIKKIILGGILSLILLTPLINTFFLSGSKTRLAYVDNVFTNPEVIKESVDQRVRTDNRLIGTLLYNRYFARFKAFSLAYVKHFSPVYLFLEGDPNPRHSTQGVGMFYLWSLPFFVLGLIFIISQVKPFRIFIVLWLILSPLSASISTPVPHALRSLMMLPILEIIISAGIFWLFVKLTESLNKFFYRLAVIIFVIVVTFFQFNHLHYYYVNSLKNSLYWADGYKQLYNYLSRIEDKYQKIYVTGNYWRPYIFMLFYNKYPPADYYKDVKHNQIGKYIFGHASYDSSDPRFVYNPNALDNLKNEANVVMALAPSDVSKNDKVIDTIYSVSGEPVFLIIEPAQNTTAGYEK